MKKALKQETREKIIDMLDDALESISFGGDYDAEELLDEILEVLAEDA